MTTLRYLIFCYTLFWLNFIYVLYVCIDFSLYIWTIYKTQILEYGEGFEGKPTYAYTLKFIMKIKKEKEDLLVYTILNIRWSANPAR